MRKISLSFSCCYTAPSSQIIPSVLSYCHVALFILCLLCLCSFAHLLRDAKGNLFFILLCLHSFLLVNNAFLSRLHHYPICKKVFHKNHACI